MTMTLLEALTGSLFYDAQWAVYAEKIDGVFKEESPARFGQKLFENGALLDDKNFFANNEIICESRENYAEGDEDFYEEWAVDYIAQINEESI